MRLRAGNNELVGGAALEPVEATIRANHSERVCETHESWSIRDPETDVLDTMIKITMAEVTPHHCCSCNRGTVAPAVAAGATDSGDSGMQELTHTTLSFLLRMVPNAGRSAETTSPMTPICIDVSAPGANCAFERKFPPSA
jgi:hypothetical protein